MSNIQKYDAPLPNESGYTWKDLTLLKEILLSLGEDPTREGLIGTPDRIFRAWIETLSGYTMDEDEIVSKTFQNEGSGLQICKEIHFVSLCEHHCIPFFGYCSVGYEANERVLGLSKISRLVDCYAKRLQIQERMVEQIADAIDKAIQPKGILVIAKAQHLCCKGRGVKQDKMLFLTTAFRGNTSALMRTMKPF